jgi:hypothetical protein
MEPLQAVAKHRAVALLEHLRVNLDNIIRPDPYQEMIEGGMVNLAEGESVGHRGIPCGVSVRDDVRSVEKITVAEAAEGALVTICAKDALPESPLVQTDLDCRRNVGPSCLDFAQFQRRPDGSLHGGLGGLRVISSDCKGQPSWVVPNDEDGPDREILPGDDPVKVDQRCLRAHCLAKADVVAMIRILASIAVAEQPARSEAVVIRAIRGRCDRERETWKHSGLENALWPKQGDALSFVLKPLPKKVEWKNVAQDHYLVLQPAKSLQAHARIAIVRTARSTSHYDSHSIGDRN